MLAVNTLYGFVDVKWGNKLLEVLFLLKIFEVNKYFIVLILFFNFIVYSVYKGLVAGIMIIDYLGTTDDNKAYLWFSNYKKVLCHILDKFQWTGDCYIIY